MPKRTIYVRKENLKKWDLIEDKSDMINKMLVDTFTDACLTQIHEQQEKYLMRLHEQKETTEREFDTIRYFIGNILDKIDSLEKQFTMCESCNSVKGEEE